MSFGGKVAAGWLISCAPPQRKAAGPVQSQKRRSHASVPAALYYADGISFSIERTRFKAMSDDSESASASFSESDDGSFGSESEEEKPKKVLKKTFVSTSHSIYIIFKPVVARKKQKTEDEDGAKPKAAPKKPKAAAAKKKAAANDDDDDTTPRSPRSKAAAEDYEKKTIEQIYQKKTPLEHILLRPDSYAA